MFAKEKLEDKIQATQRKIQELSIQLSKLDREYEQILTSIEFTPEQAQDYITDPTNFSQPIWERIQNEKKKLDEKLDLSLKGVKDPLYLKKNFAERSIIQPHWLFVR